MSAVQASLHHANLPFPYWEDAARDAIFKYNLIRHAATHASPHAIWHKRNPAPSRLFILGQLGTCLQRADKTKQKNFDARGFRCRYMYASYQPHIVVMTLQPVPTAKFALLT